MIDPPSLSPEELIAQAENWRTAAELYPTTNPGAVLIMQLAAALRSSRSVREENKEKIMRDATTRESIEEADPRGQEGAGIEGWAIELRVSHYREAQRQYYESHYIGSLSEARAHAMYQRAEAALTSGDPLSDSGKEES